MFATGLAALGAAVIAQETKIGMKDLPPAVQKAVKEHTKGAEVRGFAKEVEEGKTFYEAETKVNGRTRDLLFDPSGQLVEIEEQMSLDAVPAAVKAAFEAAGRVSKVESVTNGKTVTYEAVIEKDGKKSEVMVDRDGKLTRGE